MRITVLLFASAREAAGGADSVAVEVGAGATAGDVLAALGARGGDLARVASRARLAVNRAFAKASTPVAEGDEVALVPPVGGG